MTDTTEIPDPRTVANPTGSDTEQAARLVEQATVIGLDFARETATATVAQLRALNDAEVSAWKSLEDAFAPLKAAYEATVSASDDRRAFIQAQEQSSVITGCRAPWIAAEWEAAKPSPANISGWTNSGSDFKAALARLCDQNG